MLCFFSLNNAVRMRTDSGVIPTRAAISATAIGCLGVRKKFIMEGGKEGRITHAIRLPLSFDLHLWCNHLAGVSAGEQRGLPVRAGTTRISNQTNYHDVGPCVP